MAHAAITELLKPVGADVILLEQSEPAFCLIVGRLPALIVNLILWSKKFLRRFVAIQTPAHVQRMRFRSDRHLLDVAVAGGTADAFLNVNAVIEENEIGRLIHAIPFQRLPGREALSNRREHRCIAPDLRMTRHAGFGRR